MPLNLVPRDPYLDSRSLDALNDWEIQEFCPVPKMTKYIPHTPTFRQWAFLLLDCKEALFGGAAGGGKSDALLMAALQYVDQLHYAALLLRRTYADLSKPGALLPRSHEWLQGTDAHWHGIDRQWRFPSGAILDFGYLNKDQDKYKYQSSEYQFIGFDELTQFELGWYRYLFSRARRLRGSTVPVRMRAGSNPGGVGHDWVYDRFFIAGPSKGRVFIPARLEDNHYLDEEEYRESLSELDPITQMQLEHGDWTVRPPGQMFERGKFDIIRAIPQGVRLIRSWDLAATKNETSAYTAGVKMGLLNGEFYIAHIARIRGNPAEVETIVKQTADADTRKIEIWIEQEPGSGGVNTIWRYQRQVLVGHVMKPYHPRGKKEERAKPFASANQHGAVHLLEGEWNNAFLDEAHAFPQGYKDQIDSCSQAMDVLTQKPQPSVRRV